MSANRTLAWLLIGSSLLLFLFPSLGPVRLALLRMGLFQLALAHAFAGAPAKGAARAGASLSMLGALLFALGQAGPGGADLSMAGAALGLLAVALLLPARPLPFAVIGLAFGLDLLHLSALAPLAADGAPDRMLRLARVAAIALPTIAILYDDLPADLRFRKLSRILMAVGTVGMPVVLSAAALLSIQLKYLLPAPADAMTAAIALGAYYAYKRGGLGLESLGFAVLGSSMGVGLLMGGYAFDGPLPSPVGEYGAVARVLLRESHVASIVLGIGLVALAQTLRARAASALERAMSFQGADLDRLNQGSLAKSFVPQTDLDWSAATSDEEYERLYEVWSLLKGSGKDARFSQADRVRYVKVQQITLMRFTALLERHGMFGIAKLYDEPISPELADYIGHFIKEETYHYSMFTRAIAQIEASMPDMPPPPWRAFDRSLRFIFGMVNLVPSTRLKLALTFTMFRFAEQVTIYAHDMVRKTLPSRTGLVAQVWARHALDEARHLKFDDMVVERMRFSGIWARLPEVLILPACVAMSSLLNANEIWAARKLGAPVFLFHLPGLVKRTEAPFKRRVFGLVKKMLAGPPPLEAEAVSES